MELLERDGEREVLEAAVDESRSAGRIVVVAGEAGIGKTALVSSLADAHRVLWGACDPLITPRPMGPLRDVAHQAGGALAEAVGGSREDLLSAVLDELRAPAALVVEDLHWADDATLDFVALLGRRLPRSRGCLIVTCRPELREEVRRVLAALPRDCVRTVEPGALSADAVALLARRAGRDAADLHATTGGNPFFVTEVLAASGRGARPLLLSSSWARRSERLRRLDRGRGLGRRVASIGRAAAARIVGRPSRSVGSRPSRVLPRHGPWTDPHRGRHPHDSTQPQQR